MKNILYFSCSRRVRRCPTFRSSHSRFVCHGLRQWRRKILYLLFKLRGAAVDIDIIYKTNQCWRVSAGTRLWRRAYDTYTSGTISLPCAVPLYQSMPIYWPETLFQPEKTDPFVGLAWHALYRNTIWTSTPGNRLGLRTKAGSRSFGQCQPDLDIILAGINYGFAAGGLDAILLHLQHRFIKSN